MTLKVELADSVTEVDAESWDALVGGMPLLSHAFLSALEEGIGKAGLLVIEPIIKIKNIDKWQLKMLKDLH